MAKRTRGAVVGCGYVAQFHLAAWQRQSEVEIVAVCDRDLERANAAARRFGIPLVYGFAEALFQKAELEFVEICTRPEAHEPLVTLAAERGVAILCQKPLGTDLASIDRMIAACRKTGVRAMVHENWRFRPWYARMRQELGRGIIGRPVRLRASAHDFRCLAPGGLDDQPYFREMPRFILYEMGPHLVDIARSFFGEPSTVYCAMATIGDVVGEDAAHLVLRYAEGQSAILDLCWSTQVHPDARLEWGLQETVVEGTLGTLRVAAGGQLELALPDGSTRQLSVELTADPRLESYEQTQRHFIGRLRDGGPFATGFEDNRQAMRIIAAGYLSAERNAVIDLATL